MDTIGENDCNSKEFARLLVGSIQRLINLNQWNDFLRVKAVEDPFKFIEDVDRFADTVEKEDESKGDFHFRITGITAEGNRNKIQCIKTFRMMFGWGLADSKVSFEALPGSGSSSLTPAAIPTPKGYTIVSDAFTSQQTLEASSMWKEFVLSKHLFVYELVRLPVGTPRSQPYHT